MQRYQARKRSPSLEEHGVGEAAFFPGVVDAHCGVAAHGLVEDLAGVLQLADEAAVEQQLAVATDRYGCFLHGGLLVGG